MSSNSANNKREIIFSAIIISVGMVLLSILPVLLNNAEKSRQLQERLKIIKLLVLNVVSYLAIVKKMLLFTLRNSVRSIIKKNVVI